MRRERGWSSHLRSGSTTGRVVALVGSLGLGALGLLGCSVYEPVNPEGLIDDQLVERLGPERASRVEVPYELDDEIREVLFSRVNPSGSEKARTNGILDFVFTQLDLQYSLTPTRDAVGTYRAKSGNCLSFVNLFVGMCRQMRLNPFYVEVRDLQRWNYRDGVVVSQGHIVAGMYVDGDLSTYDFLPYRAKGYRDFQPIDDLMAMAHFYNNLGAEALLEGDLEGAERPLSVAVDLAPDFTKAINNLGVTYLRLGQTDEAIALYRRGLELNPADVALLTNLARAYQTQGRTAEAMELLLQLEEVNETSPFFFVYRGEMALGRGDPQQALIYMREALRRDSEVPEVHVGLVKVYLALGEVPKARHHLERALRLDATNREARRLLGLLQTNSADAE